MEVLHFILILALVVVIAVVINEVEEHRRGRSNHISKMSFKEALELTGLPIVTFYQGNTQLNFLLDTGSSSSVINAATAAKLITNKTGDRGNLTGLDGITREVDYSTIELTYKGKNYEGEFQVTDIQATIDSIKTETGVNMVGILGNSFFQKYQYVLDFKEFIAYQR